jgi:hypothetical protein
MTDVAPAYFTSEKEEKIVKKIAMVRNADLILVICI